jgi:hypothetical protein
MGKFARVCAAVLALLGLGLQPVGAAKPSNPIKEVAAKSIAGTQQVVIGQFTVAFLTERKDIAKAGGGLMGGGFGGKSTVRSQLAGVEPAQMQAVADAAYADFAAKLGAAGFTVVDRSSLAAALTKVEPEENLKTIETIVGKDDKAEVMLVSAQPTAPLRIMVGDYMSTGFGAAFAAQRAYKTFTAMQAYSQSSGVRVVNAIYYVNFASSDEYGGWFRNSSAVKVNSGLAIAPGLSKVSVVGPKGSPAYLELAEPVAIGGDFFTKADAMGGGEKAMRAVTKVVGLLGGIGSNSVKKFTFTALPGAYPDGATQAAKEANALFAQRLASLSAGTAKTK